MIESLHCVENPVTKMTKIASYAILSTNIGFNLFFQLVFFKLGQVLYYFLELIVCRPHRFELMHLGFFSG